MLQITIKCSISSIDKHWICLAEYGKDLKAITLNHALNNREFNNKKNELGMKFKNCLPFAPF